MKGLSPCVGRLYHLAESIQKKLVSPQLPPSMIRSGVCRPSLSATVCLLSYFLTSGTT